MRDLERPKILLDRINPFECLGQASVMMPKVVFFKVVVPMPALSWSGCTGEEGGEEDVMQHDALCVEGIQLRRTRMAWLNRARLSHDDRLL